MVEEQLDKVFTPKNPDWVVEIKCWPKVMEVLRANFKVEEKLVISEKDEKVGIPEN